MGGVTSEIICQEELEKIRNIIGKETENLEQIAKKIQNKIAEQDGATLKIAVTGESGSGKSTFINAIRGVAQDDEGAAATGVVETTMEPTEYPHPQDKNVTFWDLPGLGTPEFQAESYREKVRMDDYDFFIIIASERFKESHIQLGKDIRDMNKKFYFIRSKVDQDLTNAKRCNPKTYNEEKVLQTLREDCVNKLEEGGLGQPHVFLLCSFDLSLYDFHGMIETMQKEMPDHKRRKFLLSLPVTSLQIIEGKNQTLGSDIWLRALGTSFATAMALPGLSFGYNAVIMEETLKLYVKTFSLDEASLKYLATESLKDFKEIKSVMQSAITTQEINASLVLTLLKESVDRTVSITEKVLSFFPILGSLPAAGIAYVTTYKVLTECLQDVVKDAKKVRDLILQ
ncbi:interferon-inducible GTPase 5-like [Pelobates cultripes]|uniref:Interferon-inducible GTPase 5-like n=1 Tax=Pelobates cultripes TaxID=61616 RepID=A0AAD1T430_PELCU|nr:interferon-inducible GTPase 5-like [Pelobates cultripes]